MKKFGSKAGFTLVELIVVIAILGILAGVAVPAYSGYINKAKDASDYSQLDAIKTAAVFAYTDEHKNDTNGVPAITSVEVTAATYTEGRALNVKVNDDATVDISPYYQQSIVFTGNTFKGKTAKWNSTGDNANTWVAGT